MSDLHKLVISAPDGIGTTAEVTLDGQVLHPISITLRCDGRNTFSAVMEFDPIVVEYDGVADVVGKIVRDE